MTEKKIKPKNSNKKKVKFNKTVSTYFVESPNEYWRTFDIDLFYKKKIKFDTDCKINLNQKKNKENIELPDASLELKMELLDNGKFSNFEWLSLMINLRFSPYCELYNKLKKYYWVLEDRENVNKIRKTNLCRKIHFTLIFKNEEGKKYTALIVLQTFINILKIKFEKINNLKKFIDSIDDKILIQRNKQINEISKEYFEKLKSEQ